MSKAAEIRAKNTLTHEVNGTEYVCLRLSGQAAMRCFGVAAVVSMVDVAGATEDEIASKLEERSAEINQHEMARICELVLKECMLDPALGDEFDEATNTITLRDMCDDAQELFDKICSTAGMLEGKDFTTSSPAQKATQ